MSKLFSGASLEAMFKKGLGSTVTTDAMRAAGQADVILDASSVLGNPKFGLSHIALLDEFHHVYLNKSSDNQHKDHVILFEFLVSEVEAGRVSFPLIDVEYLRKVLAKYVESRSTPQTVKSETTDNENGPKSESE